MRQARAEIVLPVLIVLGAALLAISEFMIAFEFTPPGGEPLREVSAADRHGYSSMLLAIGAVAAMVAAIATGARAAAYACAGLGGVALLLFLVIDLPDAGKLGDLSDSVGGVARAEAEPQTGFWLQAAGALILALAAGAFATLEPEQLGSWRRRLGADEGERSGEEERASGRRELDSSGGRSARGRRYQR